jgi:sterol desaturase/sphingolipid hydroxylase (fatty acid hydroxylase superfamily)
MIWMLVYTLTWVAFFAVFLEGAKQLLAPVIRIAQLGALSALPHWLAILLGYLFAEFLGWLGHLIRHRVTLFWFFHEVHHSQTAMNPFTSYRVHPVDDLIAQAISLLPAIFFEHTLGIALLYLSIFRLHDAFIHSNIRTNLGWLRFIVMSPQAHRVHHSLDPRYYDTNMGVTLCIWDRVFGIYSPNEQVYDETGTSDAQFPLETAVPLSRWLLTIPTQLLYPYKKAIRYVVQLYPQARVVGQPDPLRSA